jgi:hypothetical protein
MTDPILFSRGKPYPLKYRNQDGATADFLRIDGNRLLIVVSDMNSKEEQSLRSGMVTAGFLYQDGALLWLFRFYGNNGRPLFTFDTPFDIRLIPPEMRQLHNIDNAEQRLLIDLHAVDEKGILRAIRGMTLSPKLTLAFLSAAQDQLAASATGERQMTLWMMHRPDQLVEFTKMEPLGR